MAASYADVDSFEISCNNPIETRDKILKIAETRGDFNILLAPMNNKMSTLGAAMAAVANPKIQVCYAPAIEYNYSNYSKPGQNCYILELPELMNAGAGDAG